MSEAKKIKNSKSKISQSDVLIRIIFIPFLLAFTLRYIPHAFLGNIKVYPEAIPISVIDDFLSEENIIEIQNLIKRERRFTTAQGFTNRQSAVPDGPLFHRFRWSASGLWIPATAVEASTGGDQGYVKFMGEQEPVNEKGKCNQSDFFSVDGKFCGFVGRVDVLKHFMATGGFWGAKETIQKLSRWI